MKTFARSLRLALMELLANYIHVLLEITCYNPKEKTEELSIEVKMKLLIVKKADTSICTHLILENIQIIQIIKIKKTYITLPVHGW